MSPRATSSSPVKEAHLNWAPEGGGKRSAKARDSVACSVQNACRGKGERERWRGRGETGVR